MKHENLDIFVKGIFSDVALIDGVEVLGIKDEKFEQFFDAPNTNTEGRKITFKTRSDESVFVEHGSIVEFEGDTRSFEVVGKQPVYDGSFIDLILQEI